MKHPHNHFRVTFISPRAYHLFARSSRADFGGAEVQMSLIARELAKNPSIQVNMMVADFGQKSIEESEDIKLIKSFNLSDNILKQILDFLFSFMKSHSDICVQRTLSPFSGLIAILCKLMGRRFIYMVAHDSETDATHPLYSGTITRILCRIVWTQASLVVSQNSYQVNALSKQSVRSILIPSVFPCQLNNTTKKSSVLWVGRCERWKRPELFIDLALLAPDLKFVMICPVAHGQEDYRLQIRTRAEKLRNLTFIDYAPFDEISAYFEDAKVYVNTSIQEGFPNTFLQAFVSRAVVVSISVNPDDLLGRFDCGFFCFDNPSSALLHISTIFSNHSLFLQVSDNGLNYIKKNHDPHENVSRLWRAILNFLD